jgi:tRNA nucleotidyltransferase (CCA-adding enzyme)
MIPFGAELPVDWYALTMYLLTQKLSPKERSLVAATKMTPAESAPWQKIEARTKKLETALKSAKLSKASLVYQALSKCRARTSCCST